MRRVLHRLLLWLMLAATIGVAVFLVYPRPSGIIGTWGGDMTGVFSQIYDDPRIAVSEARTVVAFRRDGTYTSKDSAVFVAIAGSKKAGRAHYSAQSRGTFTFDNGNGTLRETKGDRTIDGRPLDVQLPKSVTLQLRGNSTLVVTEDYGKQGRFRCSLKRQR